jgi:hypothetical protein
MRVAKMSNDLDDLGECQLFTECTEIGTMLAAHPTLGLVPGCEVCIERRALERLEVIFRG